MRRLIWGLLLLASPALAGREAGFEYAHDEHTQVFFQDTYRWSPSQDPMGMQLHLQYRLILDTEKSEPLEKLIAYAEKPWGDFKLRLGWQDISWGENLLLPILDVVNPRDVGYLRGFYDAGAKQSSPMLLTEWRSGILEAQLIAVPWAVKSRQPEEVAGYRIADERDYEAGRDGEYGGRLGVLLHGIDARAYFFRHHPREPAYRFQAFSGERDIVIDEEMVETSGLSLSYAASNWLLRTDLARHQNFPATSIASHVERTDLTQSIAGMSWTSDDGQRTVGLELHNDFWKELPAAYSPGAWTEPERGSTLLTWLGATANMSLMRSLLEPQIFFLQGVDNQDRLLRLIVLSPINDSISISSEYQKTEAKTTSPKLLLNNKETLAVRCTVAW